MERYLRLGTKAGSHVFKTGGVPAMRHGTRVVGITALTMKAINQMAARVKGRTAGRSNFARLALDGFNPGQMLFLDPLVAWTKGVWDKVLRETFLRNAWQHASRTAGLSDSPTEAAEGAAGSYIACLRHLGWTAPSFDKIFTDEFDSKGQPVLICLQKTCPRVVLMFANRRLSDIAAASSELAKRIAPPRPRTTA